MELTLFFLVAAGLSGGFVNGLAGFGTSLFALGWLLQVMPPREAVAIALACSIATGVPGIWAVRRSIDVRRLWCSFCRPFWECRLVSRRSR